MPSHLTIRKIQPADMPVLQALSASARQRYLDLPELAHIAASPPVSADRFRQGSGWVAERAGEVRGYVLTKTVDALFFIDNISTRVDTRGEGVGTRLLEHVLAAAARDGFPAVALTTFRAPAWNGPWFRRFGFLPMPADRIGPALRTIIQDQSRYLDPRQRETLWIPRACRERPLPLGEDGTPGSAATQ